MSISPACHFPMSTSYYLLLTPSSPISQKSALPALLYFLTTFHPQAIPIWFTQKLLLLRSVFWQTLPLGFLQSLPLFAVSLCCFSSSSHFLNTEAPEISVLRSLLLACTLHSCLRSAPSAWVRKKLMSQFIGRILSLLLGERVSRFVLSMPCTDWMRPTYIRKGSLLSSVYRFKC